MTEQIHDDEPDTSESVVRALLRTERAEWANAPLTYLQTSGTDNAMWRVSLDNDSDVVVRLPRRPGSASGVSAEIETLRELEQQPLSRHLRTPVVRHAGSPHERFPHHWSVLDWIGGEDAWARRAQLDDPTLELLAIDLGEAVRSIGSHGSNAPMRPAGSRGGPLRPVLDRLRAWLADPVWNADALVDVQAVRRLIDESYELAAVDPPVGFVHGDLIPGNLILDDSHRLSAIIDWGGAGIGDTAQDLAPSWSVLTAEHRQIFRETAGADDEAWLRGRGFELEHAVGGVLYYAPRGHPLANVMERTLEQILSDAQ